MADASYYRGQVTKVLSAETRGKALARQFTWEVFVQWAINDNLTEKLLKGGAKRDVADILKAVSESNVEHNSVRAYGTFSMRDQFGNVTEEIVIKVVYTKETIEKINWERFLFSDVYDIADGANIHPAFEE